MKRMLACVGILAAVFMFWASANAAEDLSGWNEVIESGYAAFEPYGTSMYVNSSGSIGNAGGKWRKIFTNAIGMKAVVNCSAAQGDAGVAILKNVGVTSNYNVIEASIAVQSYSGMRLIAYLVSEKTISGKTVRMIAAGVLGGHRSGWQTNQDITIAFARIGQDIYFYTPSNGAYVYVRPLETMGTVEESPCVISAFAAGGNANSINAVVSDVEIIY